MSASWLLVLFSQGYSDKEDRDFQKKKKHQPHLDHFLHDVYDSWSSAIGVETLNNISIMLEMICSYCF
jgi:hypothetical protein